MSSLKCIIPGVNLKVFGRAIQSLSKIGDELYIEPLEEGLFLRSVNSSRSAYACFQFAPSFFTNYIDGGVDGDDGHENDGFRCKLGMKSVMGVFRNLATIEKTVEKCQITLQVREAKLVFQLHCRHGIVKTYNLSYMESETLQAVFAKDLCPNKLTAEPKLLCDAVLNFQAHQEEVTLIVRPDFVALKNYVEDDSNPSRVVHTELTLVPDEFDNFQVGVDTDITFCLKEFRAVLAFADITNLPLSLHFEGAGRPVTFAITSDLSFEANFVLATLAEDGSEEQETSTQNKEHKKNSRSQANVKSQNNTQRKGKGKNRPSVQENVGMGDGDEDEDMELAMMDIQDITVVDNNNSSAPCSKNNNKSNTKLPNSQPSQASNGAPLNHLKQNSENPHPTRTAHDKVVTERLLPSLSTSERATSSDCDRHDPQTCSGNFKEGNGVSISQRESDSSNTKTKQTGRLLSLRDYFQNEEEDSVSPVVPNMATSNVPAHFNKDQDSEVSEEDEEIAGTPPNKKFRSLFFGTQTSTQSTQRSQDTAVVLAPNSDSDD